MFTGLIEEVGTLRAVRRGAHSAVLSIGAETVLSGLKTGDSVAVNGVCLTVTAQDSGGFTADVMHETLDRSSLGVLTPGSHVNLERAMAAGGRFGGHMVSGHIDGVGTIAQVRRDGIALWYTIEASPALLRYVVEKGSITVDGISLTVAWVEAHRFAVSIIPHTASVTVLGEKGTGDVVNLERAMAADSRFGGHIVSGHIDGTGAITQVRRDDNALWYTVEASPALLRYIVEKGSIAMDGISLTVAAVEADRFSVSVIPHTAAVTALGRKRPGDVVNLETDIIGKYVEKLLRPAEPAAPRAGLSLEFLMENGF